ncbi:MAG: PA14 domain-containing protein [Caldilineaceae bacterium]
MVADLLHWRGTRLDLPRTGLAAGDLSNVPIVGAAPPTATPTPVVVQPTPFSTPVLPNDWSVAYFNNAGLQGAPIFSTRVNAVSFNWGDGSPVPGLVPVDQFSARFERTLNVTGGIYRFSVQADDGVRVGRRRVGDRRMASGRAAPFIRRNARSPAPPRFASNTTRQADRPGSTSRTR